MLRVLEVMWIRCNDDGSNIISQKQNPSNIENWFSNAILERRKPTFRDYYLNTKTGMTQWTRPYHQKTFNAPDIEIEAFIAIIMYRDILSSR